MTRKRFVKLVMSHGSSRDMANQFAKVCVEHNVPYEVVANTLETRKVCGTEDLVEYFIFSKSKEKTQ